MKSLFRPSVFSQVHWCQEQVRIIDKQEFLKASATRQKKHKTTVELIAHTEKSPFQILKNQFLLINPEQQIVWNNGLHQLICGPPGSGKSLLLMYKGLELAKQAKNVAFVAPLPYMNFYKDFFNRNGLSDMVKCIPLDAFVLDIAKAFKENEEFEWFLDDFHHIWSHPFHGFNDAMTVLLKILKSHGNYTNHHFWLVCDLNQSDRVQIADIGASSFQQTDTIFEQELGFKKTTLLTVVRNTRDILEMYITNWKNVFLGNAEYPVPGHGVYGPKVENLEIEMKLLLPDQGYFGIAIDIVRKILNCFYAANLGQIAIIFNKHFVFCENDIEQFLQYTRMSETLLHFGTIEEQMKRKDVVACCAANQVQSFEWQAVIVIDFGATIMSSFGCLPYSRPMYYLHIIDLKPDEVQERLLDEGYAALYDLELVDDPNTEAEEAARLTALT